MAGISDYIMRKLLGEKAAAQQQSPAQVQPEQLPSSPEQEAVPPQQLPSGPGGQVDPKVDFIAKKLATITGSPEQKYQIFMQLIPQIVDAFGQPQQAPPDQGAGAGYDVQYGGMGAEQ